MESSANASLIDSRCVLQACTLSASGQQCLVCFASPRENGAKESEHRGVKPHPLVAPSLELKQHTESSRRLVYQGEPHSNGAVRNLVCVDRLMYGVVGLCALRTCRPR